MKATAVSRGEAVGNVAMTTAPASRNEGHGGQPWRAWSKHGHKTAEEVAAMKATAVSRGETR